jgi:hypothetical protein
MSHISVITITIKDLNALKAAVREFGAEFIEGQRTYAWWGKSVGDTPLPAGMTNEQLGKCDHCIKVEGVNYEIGVVKTKDGYTLAYDAYNRGAGPNGIRADGGKLLAKFGNGLKKLVQSYALNVAEMKARSAGWLTRRTALPNGAVKLSLTGM